MTKVIKKSFKGVIELNSLNGREYRMRDLFLNGAQAIHLKNDPRFELLWNKVLASMRSNGQNPFWENSISTLSKNHIKGRSDLGDMIRFFPSEWGHYARKMIIMKDAEKNELSVFPKKFYSNHGMSELNKDIISLAWDLASEIFLECLPENHEPDEYAVSLEILKYPDSETDYSQVIDLLRDSSTSHWMKVGRKWDVKRNKIRNKIPFNLPVLSKLFSAISYMPGINHVLIPINNTFYNKYSKGLKGKELIGPAHVDGDRAFTILLGSRDRVKTEVYDNKNWHAINLTTNSAHIFPGKYLNSKNCIRPTYHRYFIDELDDKVSEKKPNITLLLGIVKPRTFKAFKA